MTIKGQLKILLGWLHKIGREKRRKFIHALEDGLLCHYCRCVLNFENEKSKKFATWDHIIPRSKGGTMEDSNLVIACSNCNQTRKNMDYHEFKERFVA